jgi:hypothetical protein
MPHNADNWVVLWAVLFGYPPDAAQVQGIEDYLDTQFPGRGMGSKGWSAADLKAALSAIAERARERGTRARPPTGPDIKTAIIRARYEARQASGQSMPAESCALCSHGWSTHWPKSPPEPTTLVELSGYGTAIPCLCSAGEAITRTVAEYKALNPRQRDALKRRREIATRQTAAWLRMREAELRLIPLHDGILAVERAAQAVADRTEKTVAQPEAETETVGQAELCPF